MELAGAKGGKVGELSGKDRGDQAAGGERARPCSRRRLGCEGFQGRRVRAARLSTCSLETGTVPHPSLLSDL